MRPICTKVSGSVLKYLFNILGLLLCTCQKTDKKIQPLKSVPEFTPGAYDTSNFLTPAFLSKQELKPSHFLIVKTIKLYMFWGLTKHIYITKLFFNFEQNNKLLNSYTLNVPDW